MKTTKKATLACGHPRSALRSTANDPGCKSTTTYCSECAKKATKISNTSGMARAEISELKIIGLCRNNWRQRFVTVYEIPDSTDVISVGEAFDQSSTVICREPRNGFSNAIAMFPKPYIYN